HASLRGGQVVVTRQAGDDRWESECRSHVLARILLILPEEAFLLHRLGQWLELDADVGLSARVELAGLPGQRLDDENVVEARGSLEAAEPFGDCVERLL